jgi:phosphoribosyl 1,2-cyclic phosphate phosphodiesterase
MTPLSVTLLGTGTSTGVPVIGCSCRVCCSDDPRDDRTRCAAHLVVETPAGPVHLQIDVGPDFRRQALDHHVSRVDAVLITHHHFDHVAGLDDLRPYFFDNRSPIPLFAADNTAEVLERAMPYLFLEGSYPGAPHLRLNRVTGPFSVASRYISAAVDVEPIHAFHGGMPVLGFRIGRFAYLTDVSTVPAEQIARLADLDVLVLDALRRRHHPTHLSLDQAVAMARRVGARQTYFVHMTHDVLHAEEDPLLPDGIALAHDGLRVRVQG